MEIKTAMQGNDCCGRGKLREVGAPKVRFNIGGTLEDFLEEVTPELN